MGGFLGEGERDRDTSTSTIDEEVSVSRVVSVCWSESVAGSSGLEGSSSRGVEVEVSTAFSFVSEGTEEGGLGAGSGEAGKEMDSMGARYEAGGTSSSLTGEWGWEEGWEDMSTSSNPVYLPVLGAEGSLVLTGVWEGF